MDADFPENGSFRYNFQDLSYFDGVPSSSSNLHVLDRNKKPRLSLTEDHTEMLPPTVQDGRSARKVTTSVTKPEQSGKRRRRPKGGDAEGKEEVQEDTPGDDGPHSKPDISFYVLIKEAILSSPEQKLLLSEIYDAIQKRYPYFKTAGEGWKNSIRHNLSIKRTFYRESAEPKDVAGGHAPKKGAYWRVAKDTYYEDFNDMKVVGGGRRRGSTGSIDISNPYTRYINLGLPTHENLMGRSRDFGLSTAGGFTPLLHPMPYSSKQQQKEQRQVSNTFLTVPPIHDIGRRNSSRLFSTPSSSQQQPPLAPRVSVNRPKPMFMSIPTITETSESVYTKLEPLPLESTEMNWLATSPRMDLYIDWTGDSKNVQPRSEKSGRFVSTRRISRTPPPPTPNLEKGETYEGPTKHRQNIKEVWFGAPDVPEQNSF